MAKKLKKNVESDSRFAPPVEEVLIQLVGNAIEGKIPVRYLSVAPSELIPRHEEVLTRTRANLREEPSLREAELQSMLNGQSPAILVYRGPEGKLYSFDDYLTLAVALDASLSKVRFAVLGEGKDRLKKKDCMPTLGA